MRLNFLLLGLLLASCGRSPDEQARIAVSAAWARPTSPGQTTAAAYMTLANSGGPDRLVRVATKLGQASLHSTSMDGGVMRMRHVEAVDVPAREIVELKPSGIHIMITDLQQPLRAGSSFPVQLTFEKAGERTVPILVQSEKPDQ